MRGEWFPFQDPRRPKECGGKYLILLAIGTRSGLLTEQQISKSWRTLLSNRKFDSETSAKAEALLDELRPESPLRHRLRAELEELRRMKLQKAR